jgi:hypothetical protein
MTRVVPECGAAIREISHFAGVPGSDPLVIVAGFFEWNCRRYACQFEAAVARQLLNEFRVHRVNYRRLTGGWGLRLESAIRRVNVCGGGLSAGIHRHRYAASRFPCHTTVLRMFGGIPGKNNERATPDLRAYGGYRSPGFSTSNNSPCSVPRSAAIAETRHCGMPCPGGNVSEGSSNSG